MKSKINITAISKKLKLTVLILGTIISLQGCILGIGGEEDEEEPDFICEGITEGFDSDVSRSDCLAVGREYVEGQGCYCGPG